MKNKKILYFTIIFSLFFIAQNSFAKTTFTELKKAANQPKLTKAQEYKIKKYLTRSTSITIQTGLKILLEKKLDKKLNKKKRIIANFKIDGKISDWKHTGLIKKDPLNDTIIINEKESKPDTKAIDDLVSYGFIMNNDYIYTMLKPAKMPTKNKTYHYRINLINQKGHLIYAILWTSWGNYVQEWNPETGNYVRDHYFPNSVFSKKNIFEAKIPVAKLIKLPYYFAAEGVVWHEHHNQYDYSWLLPYEQSINEKYSKASAKLFFEYAKKTKLRINDPMPVVQSLTDGFAYKFADKKVKKEVIADGLKMINYANNNINYTFPEQKTLVDNDLEALFTWSNRAFGYGDYLSYYLTNNQRMNHQTYHFMFMDPDRLILADTMIKNNNLYDSTDLSNTIYNIESWLWEKEHYRAGLDFLKLLLEYNPGMEETYQENVLEEQNHQRVITKINGFKIKTYNNYSPTFQINYLYQNNTFYGNCGDIAIAGQVFYKALGVPTFSFSYGTIANKFNYGIHTFPIYYSSKDDLWYNYTKSGNGIYDWAKPENNQPYDVLYYVNRPQIGSYWEHLYKTIDQNDIWLTSNRYTNVVSVEKWQEINEQGYKMADFKNIIFK